jgi:hypothetical protein
MSSIQDEKGEGMTKIEKLAEVRTQQNWHQYHDIYSD